MTDTDRFMDRHRENQKIPQLPSDDPDLDDAVVALRIAVGKLHEHVPSYIVGDVVRILRHNRRLASLVLQGAEPICLVCDGGKVCVECDDVRPEVTALAPGWQFISPLRRWETVVRAEQDNEYAPVRLWTDKTRPGYSWIFPRWRQAEAAPPPPENGTSEIRIVYGYARDASMYAVPTLDTIYSPDVVGDALVAADYKRGQGWTVTHRPDGGDLVTIPCDSKAKARTTLLSAAREHARALGVKVVDPAKDKARP